MHGQRPAENAQLLSQAGVALKMTHGQLGELLEVSRRSVSRWIAQGTWIPKTDAVALARALHPVDAPLAARFAQLAEETLVSLGLEKPAPAAPVATPAAGASTSESRALDAVVCAAAEAMDASPRLVRPGLLAAVRCAKEVGLTLDAIERMLAKKR